jgi:hypothetical protein
MKDLFVDTFLIPIILIIGLVIYWIAKAVKGAARHVKEDTDQYNNFIGILVFVLFVGFVVTMLYLGWDTL